MEDELRAELRIEPPKRARRDEMVAYCTLVNTSSRDLIINLGPLGERSLALEIAGLDGNRAGPLPPPVPLREPERASLRPGQTHTADYPNFFPPALPAGAYRVRFRYGYQPRTGAAGQEWTGEALSDWSDLEVVDGA